MVQVNPDPNTKGYAFMPDQSVTSRFPPECDAHAAVRELTRTGVSAEHVRVFTGAAGADLLDTKGEKHGPWVQFVRAIQDRLTDEAALFRRADETMRAGGAVVAVYLPDPDAQKRPVGDVLNAHGGTDTAYWGGLVTEYL